LQDGKESNERQKRRKNSPALTNGFERTRLKLH
jgi:hypothetical protein